MFSRNLEKKTSRNMFDAKQSSLEKYLLQDPFVHGKYQAMKKQYLLLCRNKVLSDADKINLSKPIGTRGENPSLRTDDGVPNYFLIYFCAQKVNNFKGCWEIGKYL